MTVSYITTGSGTGGAVSFNGAGFAGGGAAIGDIGICIVIAQTSDGHNVAQNGWTFLGTVLANFVDDFWFTFFYKELAAGDLSGTTTVDNDTGGFYNTVAQAYRGGGIVASPHIDSETDAGVSVTSGDWTTTLSADGAGESGLWLPIYFSAFDKTGFGTWAYSLPAGLVTGLVGNTAYGFSSGGLDPEETGEAATTFSFDGSGFTGSKDVLLGRVVVLSDATTGGAGALQVPETKMHLTPLPNRAVYTLRGS